MKALFVILSLSGVSIIIFQQCEISTLEYNNSQLNNAVSQLTDVNKSQSEVITALVRGLTHTR